MSYIKSNKWIGFGCFVFSILISINTISQTNSFGFSEPVPPENKAVKAVDKKHFGTYINTDNIQYVFNEKGVFTVSTIMSSISQEKVRETSKYMVRGDYLFGVVEGDSTQYILKNERYYFGIKSKTTVVGEGQKNKLIKWGNTYYINFYESDNYYPSKISFEADEVHISHFDYPSNTSVFTGVENRKTTKAEGLLMICLSPSLEEWNKLPLDVLFPKTITFSKNE